MNLTEAARQLSRLYWQAQNGDRDPITPSQIEQLGKALGIDPTDRLPEEDNSEEGPV